MKKRHSPLIPPKEKKQREKKTAGLLRSTVCRARARVTRLAREVDAALDEAVAAFNATPDDRRIWAEIAWRVGAENFAHAVIDKIAEDDADGRPRRPAAAFQQFLNERFPKPEAGGQRYE